MSLDVKTINITTTIITDLTSMTKRKRNNFCVGGIVYPSTVIKVGKSPPSLTSHLKSIVHYSVTFPVPSVKPFPLPNVHRRIPCRLSCDVTRSPSTSSEPVPVPVILFIPVLFSFFIILYPEPLSFVHCLIPLLPQFLRQRKTDPVYPPYHHYK